MTAALIAAGVALVVSLISQSATRGRELAADARRYRMERAGELRAGYAVAVQLARAIKNAAAGLSFASTGETRDQFLHRVNVGVEPVRVMYGEHLASLLLEQDGAVVERLIDVMWQDFYGAQLLAAWQFSDDETLRNGVRWEEIAQKNKSIESTCSSVIEHCRRSLKALEPGAEAGPPTGVRSMLKAIRTWLKN